MKKLKTKDQKIITSISNKENNELQSLNETLYDSFEIEELERRLETAGPWACGAYVDCPQLSCGVDGGERFM